MHFAEAFALHGAALHEDEAVMQPLLEAGGDVDLAGEAAGLHTAGEVDRCTPEVVGEVHSYFLLAKKR